MPSKSTKRARRAGTKSNAPVAKDDGTRWAVVRAGTPVYSHTSGLVKGEAQRLADGLLEAAEVVQIA